MDGSDDYFTDDIVLDDQTLAVLDQEEQKFLTQKTLIPPQPAPPPAKRQKTDNGWKPGIGVRRATIIDDLEDLPEISVQGDGSYGVGGIGAEALGNPWKKGPSNDLPTGARSGVDLVRSQHKASSSGVSAPRPTRQLPPQAPSRPPSSSGHPSASQTRHPPRPRQTSQLSRNISHSRALAIPSQLPPPLLQVSSGGLLGSPQMETQVEELNKRMEELHTENLKIQTALKEAIDVKLAKEGEVSILRKGIEKTAQDHAAQLAKLKVAKDEADAKQVQMQKEMKEEIERVKTQFIFKQHEFETSTRKPPLSVHSKKVLKDPPATPIQVPSQIRGWNQDITDPSKFGSETPRRLQPTTYIKESPKAQRVRKQPFPETARRSAMLPGFQNSFIPSSPIRHPQTQAGKGEQEIDWMEKGENESEKVKGKKKEKLFGSQFTKTTPILNSPPSSPTRVRQHAEDVKMVNSQDYGEEVGEADIPGDTVFEDEDIQVADGLDEGLFLEQLDEVEPTNWKGELAKIILTHILPSSTSLTFQTLMRTNLPTSLPAASVETYSMTCARVLEILATTSKYNNFEATINSTSQSLMSMLQILNATTSISSLVALLNLLTLLIYSLPIFLSSLLSHPHKDSGPPLIIVLLCEIIRDQLHPRKTLEQRDALAKETMGILEALCWNTPDEFEGNLASIPCSPDVLSVLLHNSQPTWLLARSVRFLALFATHLKLFRALLPLPDKADPAPEQSSANSSKIPHIERLCFYLIDTTRRDADAESMRKFIVMFLAMLSISHPEALPILVDSQTLIPSLVLFLTHMTTPLWEDNEALMTSSASQASSIRTLNQTLFLLHHLIFSTSPALNLLYKLQHAPHRYFNGITHMFIVTFGRLSYADPPEWIDREQKNELEQMAEMARDLIELVVEGPEGDSVWAAYQGEPDQNSDTDDEEMEARLLGPGEN